MMRHVIGVAWVVITGCQPAPEGEADAVIDAEVDAVVADAAIVDAAWVGGLRPLPICTHGDDTGCEGSGYEWCRAGFCCNFYTCLECRGDAHCPPDAPFCRDAECHECFTDDDCGAERPFCLTGRYHDSHWFCAKCLEDADCPPERPFCGLTEFDKGSCNETR